MFCKVGGREGRKERGNKRRPNPAYLPHLTCPVLSPPFQLATLTSHHRSRRQQEIRTQPGQQRHVLRVERRSFTNNPACSGRYWGCRGSRGGSQGGEEALGTGDAGDGWGSVVSKLGLGEGGREGWGKYRSGVGGRWEGREGELIGYTPKSYLVFISHLLIVPACEYSSPHAYYKSEMSKMSRW